MTTPPVRPHAALDDDPACPAARGTYHAHGVDEEDLRLVMVVEPCMDGARATDLEAGTWERALIPAVALCEDRF